MLATNIDKRVHDKLTKRGQNGWLRTKECATEYAKDDLTKKVNASEMTKFYRWLKKVEKGKAEGFQVVKLPGNVSFIGLSSADPKVLDSFISEDKKVKRSVKSGFGFFAWLKYRDERERKKLDESIAQRQCRIDASHEYEHLRYDDPEFHKKVEEIHERCRKKHGLLYYPG
jgi:ribosomal protein S18